jgi:hypothetical protein
MIFYDSLLTQLKISTQNKKSIGCLLYLPILSVEEGLVLYNHLNPDFLTPS